MTDIPAQGESERRIPARAGIAALNLLMPGLGLLRLGNMRAAIGYIAAPFLAVALIWLVYGSVHRMTGVIYGLTAGAAIAIAALAYGGSIVQSWRGSLVRHRPLRWWSRWYGLLAIVLAVDIAGWPLPDLLRSYYRNFSVPSESMEPTIEKQDRFLARMSDFAPLQRGDIVIVRAGEVEYVKRIAALPGDRIAMRGGVVILNGAAVPLRWLPKVRRGAEGESYRMAEEQFPGEARAHLVLDEGPRYFDDYAETRLKPGQYFLLGDNRDRSADSRVGHEENGLGVVDGADIIGKAAFRYWRKDTGWGEQPMR